MSFPIGLTGPASFLPATIHLACRFVPYNFSTYICGKQPAPEGRKDAGRLNPTAKNPAPSFPRTLLPARWLFPNERRCIGLFHVLLTPAPAQGTLFYKILPGCGTVHKTVQDIP